MHSKTEPEEKHGEQEKEIRHSSGDRISSDSQLRERFLRPESSG
jgi:hypothetical protein